MTRYFLSILAMLSLSTGCGDDGTDGKKDGATKTATSDGASADPSYDSICASIFEKADSDEEWKKQAEILYTADTCSGVLESMGDRWARANGTEADSYLPGIKACVDSNDVFAEFNRCTGEVYQPSSD
jgi:hypothetical protein